MELRATTDWDRVDEAIQAIAQKASRGISPGAHADSLWLRVGTRQLTPLAILEDGRRVGTLLYEVQRLPLGEPAFHIAGLHTDGSAEAGWIRRLTALVVPLAQSLGCGSRIHFSSPRRGWARTARACGFQPVAQGYLYEGAAHG